MAKTDIAQLKNWFKNGLKPAQEHFWNWMDSFWHKDESIPTSQIDGLDDYFNQVSQDVNTISNNAAKKDASNLSQEDVLEWQSVLDVPKNDEDIEVTASMNYLDEIETQKEFNEAVDVILDSHNARLGNKLTKPQSAGIFAVKSEETAPGEYETEYVPVSNSGAEKGSWLLNLWLPYDGTSENVMYYGFVCPFDMKITKLTLMNRTVPANASDMLKMSVSVNDTFVGSNEVFLIIPFGRNYSTNVHDIVGYTLNAGDIVEFFCNKTFMGADCLQVYVEFEKIEDLSS